ncbi:MAG TPA: NUDIX domain-containing protein [Stellaceae bacterium]|nr:NUDIX domain-containing protein [Stellaceae bacterium]
MARARTETTTATARPRDAASLILLRAGGRGLEVLIGRRGKGARFMPGRYVFPGGRVAAGDARPWQGEPRAPTGPAERALLALKHAALRETFEETGLVVGRPAPASAPGDQALSPVEQAYRAAGVAPAPELLRLVGRAITPTASPIRFHARFFVADGAHATGRLVPCEELDELHWHAVAEEPPGAMQNVTRFMLTCAVDAWRGAAPAVPPLYWHRGEHTLVRRGEPPEL